MANIYYVTSLLSCQVEDIIFSKIRCSLAFWLCCNQNTDFPAVFANNTDKGSRRLHRKEVCILISYENLWITMKQRGISQYSLIHTHHISAGQLSRLRKNSYVSTHTVDTLCSILDCRVEDIMTYIRESPDPTEEA